MKGGFIVNTKSLYSNNSVEEIVNKYSSMVFKLALSQAKNKANAEDIFQEVFLRYFKTDKTFESEEHRKAWLIKVTVNCCRKLWGSAWYRNTVPLRDNLEFETEEEGELYFSVLELPLKYRTVIHLFYYEDLSVAEIGEILNLRETTIRSQLCRARAMLKVKLKGDYSYV